MGQAKARMMEMQEEEYRQAHWECPVCEEPNVSEVDIPAINTAGEPSDMNASDSAQIECEGCGEVFSGTIHNSIGGIEFEFFYENGDLIEIEHVDQHSYYDYDAEFEDYWQPSDDPNDVFEVTMEGMHNLIHVKSPSDHDKQLLNRVIFSQIITALEAYLADTLINLVKGDTDVQHKLYTSDVELKKVKFDASKIIKRPHMPELHLVSWLQRKSFHNFPMVDELFQAALGVSIYENEAFETLLNEAKDYRHDCVHRNGKTIDGEKLEIFNRDYVRSIAAAAERLVSNIEQKVVAYDLSKFAKNHSPTL